MKFLTILFLVLGMAFVGVTAAQPPSPNVWWWFCNHAQPSQCDDVPLLICGNGNGNFGICNTVNGNDQRIYWCDEAAFINACHGPSGGATCAGTFAYDQMLCSVTWTNLCQN